MPPSDRPYLYAAPARYSALNPNNGFDPKPYTRAAYMPPPPRPMPKQEGPLLDFNRHPDSYVAGVIPYGQTGVLPMHPATKKTVKIVRRTQLALRILQMIGALGMLVCVICIKTTQDTDSYIIRVPAAIDIVATAYAIYHLCRAARSRPATSSASYHFFATVIDIGLIPFYIFIVMLTRTQLSKPSYDKLRWGSFFNLDGTNKVLLSTWLDSAVLAAMHFVEAVISMFLLIVFRKISNMPPDMNPLEDNLTTRHKKSKHKHKNSEITTSSISAPLSASQATLVNPGRVSPHKDGVTADVRPLSFLQTRNSADQVYSPHNPNTAKYSRSNLAPPTGVNVYSQPGSERGSQVDVSQDYPLRAGEVPDRRDPVNSYRTTYTGKHGSEPNQTTPPLPRKSSKRNSLISDNWFVRDGEDDDDDDNDSAMSIVEEEINESSRNTPHGDVSSTSRFSPLRNMAPRPYEPVSQNSRHSQHPAPPPKDDGFLVAPLGMNPPTPPPEHSHNSPAAYPPAYHHSTDRNPRPLSTTSGNANSTSVGTRAFNGSSPSPSKSRYYGNLSSAVTGVRNTPSPSGSPSRPKSKHDSLLSFDSGVSENWQRIDVDPEIEDDRRQTRSPQRGGKRNDRQGRVLSNSGADISDEKTSRFYDNHHDEVSLRPDVRAAGLRGRNVSGKIVEEGRGGLWPSHR